MKIGLTGSMGAGKSTVAALLEQYGLTVLDADALAHEALDSPQVIGRIVTEFGSDILSKNGLVDRMRLAKAAFSDKAGVERLNAIVHPAVIEALLAGADAALSGGAEHIVFDVPLLFESGFDRYCDRVIVVAADEQTRFSRIMLRDGLSRDEIEARLKRQMPEIEKMRLADAVICNDGGLDELRLSIELALTRLGVELDKTEQREDRTDRRS